MKRLLLLTLGYLAGSLLLPLIVLRLADAWATFAGTPVRCDGGNESAVLVEK